jgi:AbrB family looped-hinge helix DNA binding protein
METTRLSSKGQIIIPKSVRTANHWREGLEFAVIDTGDGILLKPKAPFTPTTLNEVTGLFKNSVKARSDAEIQAALTAAAKRKWHARN